jgi:molybdopterin/thiamine biosynthesis adenylyltransferase
MIDPRFVRSLDFTSEADFDTIQKTKILVCGVGGMGGVCAELLVRMGFENFTITDFDHFEITNINRQIYCNENNLKKNKAEVLKSQFMLMNPKLKIKILKSGLTDANKKSLVASHDIIVNGIDNPAFSVLLRREVYLQKKFMVDAWLTPAICCFTINPEEGINPEDFMGYPTKNLNSSKEFTKEIKMACLRKDIEYSNKLMNTEEIISTEAIENILNYKYQRHFPSMVWMCGCLMATEVYKYVTKKGKPIPLAGLLVNYMNYSVVNHQEI